jgi:hypothetical protein
MRIDPIRRIMRGFSSNYNGWKGAPSSRMVAADLSRGPGDGGTQAPKTKTDLEPGGIQVRFSPDAGPGVKAGSGIAYETKTSVLRDSPAHPCSGLPMNPGHS